MSDDLVMLCKKRDEPFDSPQFIFEPKLDGVRCKLVRSPGGRVNLYSRSGRDMTAAFPDVAGLPDGERGYVLDGEIVVYLDGVPLFNHIQQRIGKTQGIQVRQACRDYPAVFSAFDILSTDGRNVQHLPLLERKAILADLAMPYQRTPYIQEKGKHLFEMLVAQGWEGIVAKHIRSPYVTKRSDHWLKVKKGKDGKFVICGFTKGKGNREGLPGALLLAEAAGKEYRYVGEVGTGLTFDDLGKLNAKLKRIGYPVLAGVKVPDLAHWCEPLTTVEVSYMERTKDGKLRFPAVKRIHWR